MRLRYTKAFTIAELLVAVAIIGTLTAVSIPIFSAQTKKAKAAADMANVRAAKSAAVAAYLSSGESVEKIYYYSAAEGTVTDNKTEAASIEGYGKSDDKIEGADGYPCKDGTAQIVAVTVHADGSYTAAWGFKTEIETYYEKAVEVRNSYDSGYHPDTQLMQDTGAPLAFSSSEIFLSSEVKEVPGTLYWKPKVVTINGSNAIILFASSTSEIKADWSAYAFYYDGTIYKTSRRHFYTKLLQSNLMTNYTELNNAINGTSSIWTKAQ